MRNLKIMVSHIVVQILEGPNLYRCNILSICWIFVLFLTITLHICLVCCAGQRAFLHSRMMCLHPATLPDRCVACSSIREHVFPTECQHILRILLPALSTPYTYCFTCRAHVWCIHGLQHFACIIKHTTCSTNKKWLLKTLKMPGTGQMYDH